MTMDLFVMCLIYLAIAGLSVLADWLRPNYKD